MPGPLHFDAHAALYDRGRPPYPDQLWTCLGSHGWLSPGGRVVELGAGSGLATRRLLAAGARVTAVEPGPALAGLLRERCPDASIILGTAEETGLDESAFDLAVIATAVHWLDLGLVLPKLHAALTPGGHLAVWRNAFGDPSVSLTPFRERVAQVVDRRPPGPPRSGPGELATAAWADALEAGGYFERVLVEEFAWAITLDRSQVRDLFTTFSDWSAAEADEVARSVDDLGGRVVEHYRTPLVVLRRTGHVPSAGNTF
ncbi:class I SAM-dependent methyltransferase [Kineosporia mesophila]|uniref:class I SAM-dependent methyltransferase n=1 Tax=Kineosporia mesophila TaxID=566012 RepID=UPI001E2A012F|nr:class I SAM-dependent methyltransferase [Kineosporia mesophila]